MAKIVKGIAGIWEDEHLILKAAAKTREMGFQKFEAISAYPVHGMEEACGIKRSWIPYVTFVMGVVGLTAGLLLTWWTSAVDWKVNVGGKPFFSLPAFIPIMFELTILFAALSSVVALFKACGIPRIDPPIIDPDLSSHKFAIFIPHNDVNYDESKIEAMFKELGATSVKKTEY
ncbi:DUF3341 domain-containing protein [Bdellovibrio reynosensis]|uniref:DUF3341 domain-containing protein n=1 Tax=Bdellovibrio reynosensis TaxID=2835041 RepID=A0ABY4CBG5_9BACT|nr:DUF3341 domain-containing protein [Bdellovibrio reynosensis]UOF02316.1 DUF3341 domain-containing protein [Bdellovibrio reynosensis]